MSVWTLLYEEEERLFEDWGLAGLSQLSRIARNQMPTEVTFIEEGKLFDDDASFEVKKEITIKKDGVVWFVGLLRNPTRQANAEGESIQWSAIGVGNYLDRLIFRQPWKYLSVPGNLSSTLNTVYLSHLILFQKADGTNGTIKEQAQEIFTRLIEAFGTSPKLAYDGSKAPTHYGPFIEIHNQTSGAALRETLHLAPDCALWEDYSTTPPTIRIAPRGSLDAENLVIYPLGEGPTTNDNTSIRIVPRYDLQVKSVQIEFELSSNVNGRSSKYTVRDVWPPDSDAIGFDALPQTVSLEGQNLNYPVETISTDLINVASVEWWKARVPSLAKANIRNLKIRAGTRTGTLPRFLLPSSGPWASWMPGLAENIVVEAEADYEVWDTKTINGVPTEIKRDVVYAEPLHLDLVATNLLSGTYEGPLTGTLGEPVPTGLAKALYIAASELQYDGEIETVDEECSGRFSVGKVINIQGSRSEWTSMRAMIQEVHENIDDGRTRIVVGPAKFLGVDDLMEWMRGMRARNLSGWASRTTGLQVGGALQLASKAPQNALQSGTFARERMVLYRPEANSTQTPQTLTAKIVLDILDALGLEVKLREMKVCDNGVTRYGVFMCSTLYDSPLTPP